MAARTLPALLAGLVAALGCGLLLAAHSPQAPVPLVLYLLLLLLAPVFPAFPFYLPIISRGSRYRQAVALTFDDGPDPAFTPALLDLLDRHGVKAAFFVIGAKAQRHPQLIQAILERGHEIGNHSYSHFPWLMLMGQRVLRREIEAGQGALLPFAIVPRAFRPPVGISAPALGGLLQELGMDCVNFSCRAPDLGNRLVRRLAARILAKVRPGDIVLLHDVLPPSSDGTQLLAEFEALLAGLRARELEILPLSQLTGRAVMTRIQPHTA